MHPMCMWASKLLAALAGVNFLRCCSCSLMALVALKNALHMRWPECAILSHSLLHSLLLMILSCSSLLLITSRWPGLPRCIALSSAGCSEQHAAYEGLVACL
ncbi:hypothetical protein CVIRNUC_008875 [Coccomyxa viridis]|uniref:Secreted protein n=1 Tax=Coccomyxa viridis TaxID=1274662 RepID=A0AAV1IF07_9CHLO|nr:hypothetical protein CVIRNUC_008875 [Coccomyxa viridis]